VSLSLALKICPGIMYRRYLGSEKESANKIIEPRHKLGN